MNARTRSSFFLGMMNDPRITVHRMHACRLISSRFVWQGLDPPITFTYMLISHKLFDPFVLCCFLGVSGIFVVDSVAMSFCFFFVSVLSFSFACYYIRVSWNEASIKLLFVSAKSWGSGLWGGNIDALDRALAESCLL